MLAMLVHIFQLPKENITEEPNFVSYFLMKLIIFLLKSVDDLRATKMLSFKKHVHFVEIQFCKISLKSRTKTELVRAYYILRT